MIMIAFWVKVLFFVLSLTGMSSSLAFVISHLKIIQVYSTLGSLCTLLDALLANDGLLCHTVRGTQYCKGYSVLVRPFSFTSPIVHLDSRYDL
jgi:hypothetical protein